MSQYKDEAMLEIFGQHSPDINDDQFRTINIDKKERKHNAAVIHANVVINSGSLLIEMVIM